MTEKQCDLGTIAGGKQIMNVNNNYFAVRRATFLVTPESKHKNDTNLFEKTYNGKNDEKTTKKDETLNESANKNGIMNANTVDGVDIGVTFLVTSKIKQKEDGKYCNISKEEKAILMNDKVESADRGAKLVTLDWKEKIFEKDFKHLDLKHIGKKIKVWYLKRQLFLGLKFGF